MTAAVRDAQAGPRAALRYALPALDGAAWLGLRPSALVALALTTTAAVTVLTAGLPVPLALLVLTAGTALAALPLAGRSPLAWTPVLLTHLRRRATGRTGWSADPSGSRVGLGSGTARTSVVRLDLPGEYGRLDLLGIGAAGSGPDTTPLGVLQHRGSGTATVVLDVTGPDRFALLEPSDQDSQLARWGTCLSALAADPQLVRMQWLTHTRPATRDHPPGAAPAPRPDLDTGTDDPARTAWLRADQADLALQAAQGAQTHQHLLALTVGLDAVLAGGRRRGRPGSLTRTAPTEGQALALVERVRDQAATLLTADLLPQPLTAPELGTALRRLLDPTLPDGPDAPDDPSRWAIRSRRTDWDSCRTDDTWHRSFAVTGWPRLALPADWLAPLLHTPPPAGTSRTLAVHADPVAPHHAARQARAARAKARLDAVDRGRLGFTSHAGDELAETDAAELEAELVAGYHLTRLTGLVSVSAPDRDRLRAATAALRTLAVSNRLDLRPLHGQHAAGLVGCLPLGLPLPGARP